MWAMARIPGRANELALYIAITSAPETVQGVPLHFLMWAMAPTRGATTFPYDKVSGNFRFSFGI